MTSSSRNSVHSMRRCSSMHPRGLGLGFFSFEEGDGDWNFRVLFLFFGFPMFSHQSPKGFPIMFPIAPHLGPTSLVCSKVDTHPTWAVAM
jgi:hypothetical protein